MGRGRGPWFCWCDPAGRQRVVPRPATVFCGLCHRRYGEGPRGASRGALLLVSTDVRAAPVPEERRRGVAPLVPSASVGSPAHPGGGRSRPPAVLRCTAMRWPARELGVRGLLRIVLDERGARNRLTRTCAFFCFSADRPRASPEPAVSWVTGLLSPAVRPLPRSEVPRRTARSARLIAPESHAWFFSGPPLAGTDTGTNDAPPGTVTRRTGECGPELRCDRGTVRAGSCRGRSPACPAPPCSARGSPSRGRGSRAALRR